MTKDASFKAVVRRYAQANNLNYTAALRHIEAGNGYPMDPAAEGYYFEEGAIEGPVLREMFRRRIDFITNPFTTPEQVHEHLVNGHADIDVRDTAALRSDLLPETLDWLVRKDLSNAGMLAVAQNPKTQTRTLGRIVRRSNLSPADALRAIVDHPNADEALLRRLSKLPGRPEVRELARAVRARRFPS